MGNNLRYHGYYEPVWTFCDNHESNQVLIKKGIIPRKKAERMLAFNKRFKPNVPHTRLLAHRVKVYSVHGFVWERKKTFSVPVGKLELEAEFDFAVEMSALKTGLREVVVEKDAVHKLPDGSEIRGDKVKLEPSEGNLEALKQYFNLEIDPWEMLKEEGEGYHYLFDIRRDTLSRSRPLEFHVEKYFEVDNVPWKSSKEVGRVKIYNRRRSFNTLTRERMKGDKIGIYYTRT